MLSILLKSAAFAFFSERPLEMIVDAPRRCMKDSTVPLNALWTARSTLMVPVAYFAPAGAARPLPLTPAAFASLAKSTFHSSNPAAVSPHEAACAAPVSRQSAAAPLPRSSFPWQGMPCCSPVPEPHLGWDPASMSSRQSNRQSSRDLLRNAQKTAADQAFVAANGD